MNKEWVRCGSKARVNATGDIVTIDYISLDNGCRCSDYRWYCASELTNCDNGLNGYKFGVEYPTNGKKPDFMDAVKKFLSYDPISGVFTWVGDGNNQVKAGAVAGTPDRKGYIQITLNGKRLKAHRLAYAICNNINFNEIPKQIDHIDGVKFNNAIINLRAATGCQNQHNRPRYANNTSGFKGVTWSKRNQKWQAQIQVGGNKVHVGYFDSIFDAANAYDEKAMELHKEFALTNKSMGLLDE